MKVACGRSLTQMSFDPSTLVYWRRRIVVGQIPNAQSERMQPTEHNPVKRRA